MKKSLWSLFFISALCVAGCGNKDNSTDNVVIDPTHQHTFSNTWSSDDTYHWHASTCGHNVVSDKATHSYSSWIIDKYATMEEKGHKHRICDVCYHMQEEDIPVLDHDHVPGEIEITNVVEATCGKEGSHDEIYKCIFCGEVCETKHVIDPKKEHQNISTSVEEVAATCTTPGKRVTTTTCLDCGTVISTNTETIPPLNHQHTHKVLIEPIIEPTCKEEDEGLIERYQHYQIVCDDCGEVITDDWEYVEPIDHNYVSEEIDPTFEEDGYIKYTCTGCGDTYTVASGKPKLPHNYSDTWSSDSKNHYHACIDEGYETLQSDVTAHDFLMSFVEPTYNDETSSYDDGYYYKECSVCGYHESIPLSKELYDERMNYGIFPIDKGDSALYGKYPTELITDAAEIETLTVARKEAHKYNDKADAIFKYQNHYYYYTSAKNNTNGWDQTTPGTFYYFRMDVIDWYVIERYEDGSALLLSKNILDGGVYDGDSCLYADSDLRARINNTQSYKPLDLMFGSIANSAYFLRKHTVKNSSDATQTDPYMQGKYESSDTRDYLSIPSVKELTDLGGGVAMTVPTKYARAMDSDTRRGGGYYYGDYSYYWTRTPQSTNWIKAACGIRAWPTGQSEPTEPYHQFVGYEGTRSLGLRYVIRVQLDMSKPNRF